MPSEIHLEKLVGKKVVDSAGEAVGRIEEVRAEWYRDECFINEYLVGRYAVLERLSAWHLGRAILGLLPRRATYTGYRVPWDAMDLGDPEHPRAICPRSELRQIE
jgi:sporulation protein YlmC with PRC-barrel domain